MSVALLEGGAYLNDSVLVDVAEELCGSTSHRVARVNFDECEPPRLGPSEQGVYFRRQRMAER